MVYGMDEAGLFPAWIWCVDGSFRYHGCSLQMLRGSRTILVPPRLIVLK